MHTINKILLSGALAALAASCGEEQMPATAESDVVEVPVSLSVTVAHNMGLQSRAVGSDYVSTHNPSPRRPVTWKSEQSVDDLRVYVFESESQNGRYVYAGGGDCADGGYLVKDFHNLLPWGYDEFESHEYAFTPRLRKGYYYKFLAVGRDDNLGTPIPTGNSVTFIPWGTRTMSEARFEYGVTEIHRATLTNELMLIQYPYVTTEIFTGIMKYTDGNGQTVEDYVYVEDRKTGFQKEIVLERAVAGLWAYFTDIPTKAIDNSGRPLYQGASFQPNELTVRMTLASKELNLVTRSESLNNEQKESIPIGYVDLLNRYGDKGDAKWHTSYQSPYWQRDKISDYLGVRIDANCALMSNFLLPVSNLELLEDGESIFTVELRESQADHVTTRKVKCRIDHVTDPMTGETHPYTGDGYKFPIMANCLYVLGSPEHPISLAGLASGSVGSRGDDDEIVMTVIEL